jgi:hypothetical protein
MSTNEERLAQLEEQVRDLYAFKGRVESRITAGDATVMNFLVAMEDRIETRFTAMEARLDDVQAKQLLMYELLLRLLPPQSQQ